jgi:penicillin-binding protein 2
MEIREDLAPLRRRTAVIMIAVFVALGALHFRIAQLQIIQGASWRRMAENNRLRQLPLNSRRGRIYDRRGALLAENLPTWDLLLFPDEARDISETILFLAQNEVADGKPLHALVTERHLGRLAPLVVAENLSWDQLARVRSHQSDHPELAIVSGFRRDYPNGDVTAHAVGHLRLVSQLELDLDSELDPNTLVGATGIEALQNDFLSGRDGERFVVVSAVGQQLGVVRETPSLMGHDLGTTIDLELQRVAASAMGEASGAVVAMEPNSGAIRVLYSAPSFDPNAFVGRLSQSDWRQLAGDQRHPLQDRSTQGVYPPGSTVKPFYLLAGLAEGIISPHTTVTCTGSVSLYGHRFRCWRRDGHGVVDAERSLEVSCDTYYYLLGHRLGIERMASWLGRFGFGQPTGIGLGAESPGLVGTPDWSRRVRGTPWYPGEAISVAIGQGPVLTTSLQLARAYSALANRGRLVTPHLVEPARVPPAEDLALNPGHLKVAVDGLGRVVHGSEGTAIFLSELSMAGKTGTAQVARLQEGVEVEDLAPHLRHHAWFVGWAPLEDPRLVVVVIVEHGGGGGRIAAPVAAAVIREALGAAALAG